MPAPVVPVAAFGVAKAITWIVGMLAGAWVANKAVTKFGATPANTLENYGIPPREQFAAAKEAQKNKQEFLEKLNKERKDENEKLKEELNKLNKRLLKETEEWKNESDPSAKNAKFAIMKSTEKELQGIQQQIDQNNVSIQKTNEEITKAFESIGNVSEMTQNQFSSRANSPDWTKLKNYGIITLAIIIGVMIISFVKKIFSSLLSSIN